MSFYTFIYGNNPEFKNLLTELLKIKIKIPSRIRDIYYKNKTISILARKGANYDNFWFYSFNNTNAHLVNISL